MSNRDPLSTRDITLARIDTDKAKALVNLRMFENCEREAERKGDPSGVLSAVRIGLDAVRDHLRNLSEQRQRWVS